MSEYPIAVPSTERSMVTLPRSSVMTEGLGIVTLPTRLEPSERISLLPERILTSVMFRPESLLSPANMLASCVGDIDQAAYPSW